MSTMREQSKAHSEAHMRGEHKGTVELMCILCLTGIGGPEATDAELLAGIARLDRLREVALEKHGIANAERVKHLESRVDELERMFERRFADYCLLHDPLDCTECAKRGELFRAGKGVEVPPPAWHYSKVPEEAITNAASKPAFGVFKTTDTRVHVMDDGTRHPLSECTDECEDDDAVDALEQYESNESPEPRRCLKCGEVLNVVVNMGSEQCEQCGHPLTMQMPMHGDHPISECSYERQCHQAPGVRRVEPVRGNFCEAKDRRTIRGIMTTLACGLELDHAGQHKDFAHNLRWFGKTRPPTPTRHRTREDKVGHPLSECRERGCAVDD